MVARYTSWGLEGEFFIEDDVEIPTKPCTEEMLGINGHEIDENSNFGKSEGGFYPVHKLSQVDLSFFWKKLKCFDYEAMAERQDIPHQLEV